MAEPHAETTKHKPDAAFRKTWATQGAALDIALEVGREIKNFVIEKLGRQQSKMVAELMALRGRVKDLEAQAQRSRGTKYCGVWSPVETYDKGDFCTHDGSVWHANASTRSKPGTDDSFTLAVKRGRDGKDSR